MTFFSSHLCFSRFSSFIVVYHVLKHFLLLFTMLYTSLFHHRVSLDCGLLKNIFQYSHYACSHLISHTFTILSQISLIYLILSSTTTTCELILSFTTRDYILTFRSNIIILCCDVRLSLGITKLYTLIDL